MTNLKRLFLHNNELISYGCRNCLWRLHDQCVHGDIVTKDNDFYTYTDDTDGKEYSGYCPEYVDFLLSLAGDSGSLSVLKEQYALYSAELQRNLDYTRYMTACKELALKKREGPSIKDRASYEMDVRCLRMWWERLNETIIKGRGKSVDRESRSDNVDKVVGVISLSQIHKIAKAAKESIDYDSE